jgi:hypothetical protein
MHVPIVFKASVFFYIQEYYQEATGVCWGRKTLGMKLLFPSSNIVKMINLKKKME